MATRLTRAQRLDRAISLYIAGDSRAEAARKVRISGKVLKQALDERGITQRPPGEAISKARRRSGERNRLAYQTSGSGHTSFVPTYIRTWTRLEDTDQ